MEAPPLRTHTRSGSPDAPRHPPPPHARARTYTHAGGGYTKNNVARCWTNETAVLLGRDPLDDALPPNDYYEYYAPDHRLR